MAACMLGICSISLLFFDLLLAKPRAPKDNCSRFIASQMSFHPTNMVKALKINSVDNYTHHMTAKQDSVQLLTRSGLDRRRPAS